MNVSARGRAGGSRTSSRAPRTDRARTAAASEHVDAEAAHLVADARESFDERDTDRRISVDDVLAQIRLQLAAHGSKPRLEPFGCGVERTGVSGAQRVHQFGGRLAGQPSTKPRPDVDDSH